MTTANPPRFRVLLVEDNAVDMEFAKRSLLRNRPSEFEVCCVGELSDALQHLQTTKFDAMLLDLGLPEYGGLEALLEVRDKNQEIPVVVITGLNDEQVALEAIEKGAQDYLVKGQLTADSLRKSIHYAIQRQQLLAAAQERELAVRQAKARKSAMLESALDAIITIDSEGVIVEFNPAAERTFGHSRTEILGKSMQDLLVPLRYREQHRQGFARYLATGEPRILNRRLELAALRADGAEFPVELTITRIPVAGPPMFTAFIRDISEAKRAVQLEEQFHQAQKLEAVGSLAGGIAHEFNNLLQAITGYTQFAIAGLPAEEQRFRDLQLVLKAADRATSLTRQLLSFGRRQVLNRANIDPNHVVAELVTMLRPLIAENIEIQTILAPQVDAIYADSGQMQQVLLNLCINARDAMPKGGHLLIRTQNVTLSDAFCEQHAGATPGPHVLFSVTDNGCGMSAEVQEHIFEPFFTTKELGKGTGLGLAMVYGVVEQHGGSIHVYSEPGAGTTFKIYLPAIGVGDTKPPVSPNAELAGGSETILVAEDDLLVRSFIVRVLQEAGYQTLEAVDGIEALRVFMEHTDSIALALLDMVMPRMGGRVLFQRIRQIRPNLPVLFCTGHDPGFNESDAVIGEGLPLLQKPIDPVSLLQTIRKILDTANHYGNATVPASLNADLLGEPAPGSVALPTALLDVLGERAIVLPAECS